MHLLAVAAALFCISMQMSELPARLQAFAARQLAPVSGCPRTEVSHGLSTNIFSLGHQGNSQLQPIHQDSAYPSDSSSVM